MKKILFPLLILFSTYISGCSIPIKASCKQLYSFTKEEIKIREGFSKRMVISIKDFREKESYDEDIIALEEKVEKYILGHPELSESAKNNLRKLKVSPGSTKEEVKLLLGKPDKVTKAGNNVYAASQKWIYRINNLTTFTIFFLPVFYAHEGYYLYFKDDILAAIERHSLKETTQATAPDLIEREKKK